jgi:hypothetical protein
LSLPDKIFNHEDLPKDLILPLWSVIQKHINEKHILTAGLSDFNAKYLEQLSNALNNANV